ncbi:hypothetical protein D3C76_773540 [compost metagenome]
MDAVAAHADPLCEVLIGWAAYPSGHLGIGEEDTCIGFCNVTEKLDHSLSRDNKTVAEVPIDYSIQYIGAQAHVVFLSSDLGESRIAIYAGEWLFSHHLSGEEHA